MAAQATAVPAATATQAAASAAAAAATMGVFPIGATGNINVQPNVTVAAGLPFGNMPPVVQTPGVAAGTLVPFRYSNLGNATIAAPGPTAGMMAVAAAAASWNVARTAARNQNAALFNPMPIAPMPPTMAKTAAPNQNAGFFHPGPNQGFFAQGFMNQQYVAPGYFNPAFNAPPYYGQPQMVPQNMAAAPVLNPAPVGAPVNQPPMATQNLG